MSLGMEYEKKPMLVFWTSWKVRALGLIGFGLAAVGTVSAATDLNTTIAPIIIQITLLFTPLLAVIIGAVPLVVTLAISDGGNKLPLLADRVYYRHTGNDSNET